VEELLEIEEARRRLALQIWTKTPETEKTGARSTSENLVFSDVKDEYNARLQDYQATLSKYNLNAA
jgi:hypothetical protein